MKKFLSVVMCAAVVLSLTACNNSEEPIISSDIGTNNNPAENNSPVTTPAPAVESKAPDTESNVSDSNIESGVSDSDIENNEPARPAAQEVDIADLEYIEENGGITITRYDGNNVQVVFPAEINGIPVRKIGNGDNVLNGALPESVVIPDGVTSLGARAFLRGSNLAYITIPESVTDFGVSIIESGVYTPFTNTMWLSIKKDEDPLVIVNNVVIDGRRCTGSVEIPKGVRTIASCAFAYCTTITDVSFPESLETIGGRAFLGCEQLTEIALPDSVTDIGHFAFRGCSALEEVALPDNDNIVIGRDIFYNYRNDGERGTGPVPWLEEKQDEDPLVIVNSILVDGGKCSGGVVVPDSVKTVAYGAFDGASRLESLMLPDGITVIPGRFVSGCTALQSITIPDSVTEIGGKAFENCRSLRSITLPDSVSRLDANAFADFNADVIYKGTTYSSGQYKKLYAAVNG